MKNLIIIATGAVAAELTTFIKEIKAADIQLKGYLEYDYNIEKYYNSYRYDKPVLGDIDSYIPQPDDYFLLGVAHIGFRNKVIETLKMKGAKFYTLIHPTALVSEDAQIGEGCLIGPFCCVGPNAVVGDFNHLSAYSCVSHDCKLGRNNSFSSTIVCGHVTIGDENSFYVRSTVCPDLTIGSNCVIQAGMIVDKNVPDGTTVFYRFKEKVLAIPKVEE